MRKSVRSNGIYHVYNISNEIPFEELRKNHCNAWYEILFVMKGTGRFIIDGREYPIRPHSMFLLAPFEHQHIEIDDDCTVYERQVIFFTPNDLDECTMKMLESMMDHKNGIGIFYPPSCITKKITVALAKFNDLYNMTGIQKDIYARALLAELLVFTSLTNCDEVHYNSVNLGAQVVEYINENLDSNISLDELSKRFFVSKYYLCRAFKKHNGVSVHGYINRKRIVYAKHLIDSGESASVAAYKVGFGDYSAFYRAYVKILGTSPTADFGKKDFVYENS